MAPDPFTGLSVSVPDPEGDGWRQTWVDSNGSYWHFVGGPQPDGTFMFATPEPVDADRLYKRMVFSEIVSGPVRLAVGVIARRHRVAAAVGDRLRRRASG